MHTPDFTLLSAQDAAEIIVRLPPNEIESILVNLSPEQLQVALTHLHETQDPSWRHKVRAFLSGLSQRHQLEAVGRALSHVQMLEMLDACIGGHLPLRDKLEFVLVGLPQPVFESVLQEVNQAQLQVLKDLGNTESIQHHLTLLVHELVRLAEAYATDLDALERQIEQYDVRSVRQGDIDSFMQQIEDTSTFFTQGLHTIDTALALAWNTNREDLIERLTLLKETWLRYLQFAIGRPGAPDRTATALYAKLEERLNAIYGAFDGGEGLIDADPAIEALAALSLWVLHDYWEVGLLPHIETAACLDLEPGSHSEEERALYRDKLLHVAQDNLCTIGLSTVGDLKRAHIYSRNMLIRYVQTKLMKSVMHK